MYDVPLYIHLNFCWLIGDQTSNRQKGALKYKAGYLSCVKEGTQHLQSNQIPAETQTRLIGHLAQRVHGQDSVPHPQQECQRLAAKKTHFKPIQRQCTPEPIVSQSASPTTVLVILPQGTVTPLYTSNVNTSSLTTITPVTTLTLSPVSTATVACKSRSCSPVMTSPVILQDKNNQIVRQDNLWRPWWLQYHEFVCQCQIFKNLDLCPLMIIVNYIISSL